VKQATDAEFNSEERMITMKLDIYFNPSVLTVTPDNYLIDCNWLEEVASETKNPLGTASANDMSFTLFNEHGLFTPTNKESPYFGRMKLGVKVVPYIRPLDIEEEIEYEWIQVGEYFVTDWSSAIAGTNASVTATDKMLDVLNEEEPDYLVELDVSFKQAFTNLFKMMGYEVKIGDGLDRVLQYSFVDGSRWLHEMLQGAIAFCTADKNGDIVIKRLTNNQPIRATLTDGNQIKDAKALQSIIKSYSGVELTYTLPQLKADTTLLNLSSYDVKSGRTVTRPLLFSNGPMLHIHYLAMTPENATVSLTKYHATPWFIVMTFDAEFDSEIALVVNGTIVDLVQAFLTDSGAKLLKVENKYIQDDAYAVQYKKMLNTFVSSDVPNLELGIRGNPLLNVGDKVVVQSDKYNLLYTGLIQRMAYRYRGGLSCVMTLLNAEVIGEF